MDMSFQVDWNAALANVSDNRDLLQLVIDAFLTESAQIRDQISIAITNQDTKQLQRTGHTLKGIMHSVGASSWSHPARQLEELGAAGTTDGAQELADELNRHLPALLEQLRTFSVEQSN
jgi:HPt (histidine-containing phosphotransfer) domain-containing protein